MGGCGLFLIFLIILGPLVLFSTLNPTLEPNPVISLGMDIGVLMDKHNYFKLFHIGRVDRIYSINDK